MKRTEKLKSLKYLNFIINPIDGLCNLRCQYCYSRQNIGDKNVVGKKFSELSIFGWFPLLLKNISLLSSLEGITFTWHGGEPLLLPNKFYLEMVELQRKILGDKFRYNNVLQTNGTLLDPERALFFLNQGFDIGISIDGPDFKHNRQRFKSRKDFEKLKTNLFNFTKNKIPFALFMVIHEENINSEKLIFSFLKRLSPQNGVSLIPRFNGGSYLNPEKYSQFLQRLFDLWWPAREPYIAIFENFISGIEGRTPRFCFLNNKCNLFISIDSEGMLYNTCQPRTEIEIGKIGESNLQRLILEHNSKIKKILNEIKNKSLCDYLGETSKYGCFSGKGCLKRLIDGRDPYIESFAKIINHIERRINDGK